MGCIPEHCGVASTFLLHGLMPNLLQLFLPVSRASLFEPGQVGGAVDIRHAADVLRQLCRRRVKSERVLLLYSVENYQLVNGNVLLHCNVSCNTVYNNVYSP